MGLNTKDNQIHWERHQKRVTRQQKEAKRSAKILRDFCKATGHIEDRNHPRELVFSVDWLTTIVKYKCARCGGEGRIEKPTTFTYIMGTSTGRFTSRFKPSGTP